MTKREKRKLCTEEIFNNYKRIKEINLKIEHLQIDKDILETYNIFLEDLLSVLNSNEIKEMNNDD